MSLTKWFSENWVDISRPKKGGGFHKCGRNKAGKKRYPKCVPAAKAARMTPEKIIKFGKNNFRVLWTKNGM